MLDLFLFSYVTIGALYAIWFVVRYCASIKSIREQVILTGIAFTLWPAIWCGVALDKIRTRWRRRSLEFR